MKRKVVVALLVTVMQMQVASAQSSVGNFLTGDAKVSATLCGGRGQLVPKPDQVVIHDFAVRATGVTLDQSIAGRIRKSRLLRHGNDEDSTPAVSSLFARRIPPTPDMLRERVRVARASSCVTSPRVCMTTSHRRDHAGQNLRSVILET